MVIAHPVLPGQPQVASSVHDFLLLPMACLEALGHFLSACLLAEWKVPRTPRVVPGSKRRLQIFSEQTLVRPAASCLRARYGAPGLHRGAQPGSPRQPLGVFFLLLLFLGGQKVGSDTPRQQMWAALFFLWMVWPFWGGAFLFHQMWAAPFFAWMVSFLFLGGGKVPFNYKNQLVYRFLFAAEVLLGFVCNK